jgi:CRISPR system Cascade subunit CasD
MTDYLLFTLYSPLSSWGEIAVGEVRASKTHPGRSAILGLVAASLGIRRDDSASMKLLHDCYKLGVKVISTGNLLKDFHTIQAARSQKKIVYRRRADEVNADPDLQGTIISSREYRSDALYIVALWTDSTGIKFSLQNILKALKEPVFVPYLGRKSCPPACNFAPEIIIGKENLKDAFDQYKVKPICLTETEDVSKIGYYEKRIFRSKSEMYYWDECMNSGFNTILTTERYDTVRDSSRRQFSPRRESMTLVEKEKE